MWNGSKSVAVIAALCILTACQKEATGQVAAVVNGEEITLQEINAQLSQLEIPEGADREEVQKLALQRIIDLRLLAQAARREGVDKTPEFLVRRRQLEDALLVQLLGQATGRTAAVPDARAIDEYIQANPALFGGRTIFSVDRIQFPVPADRSVLRSLENDGTMDAVANRLRELGIDFTRDEGQMDSARLGQDRLNRIRALPEGEPFVIPEGGTVTVAVITGQSVQPVAEDEARPAAVQLMRSQALSGALRQRLENEKASAEIEYQEGFAPAEGAAVAPQT